MKTLILVLLLAVASQAVPYLCVLKTKSGSARLAPVLADPKVRLHGVLEHYVVQDMDKSNPMTVIGLDTRKLDYRKPYSIDFVAQAGARSTQFKVTFLKNTGLVVQVYSEATEKFFSYEFIEASSSAPSVSIQHKNGANSSISCLPN